MLEPEHADLDVLEAELGRREGGRQSLEQLDARVDAAPHWPRMVEGRREREAAVERNEPVGRLEAGHAAAGGRDPDRAAGVAAQCGVGKARRERRRRAAARAAGEAILSERVRHGSKVRVLGSCAVGELVQVRLADVPVVGGLGAPHCFRGLRRDVVGEEDRAVGRDEPRCVEEILHGEPLARSDGVGVARPGKEDPFGNRSDRSHSSVTVP